jgi:hypothetical protein
MKLVRWQFQGLVMPMIQDENGELYCTSKAICEALGVCEETLRYVYNTHKEEFSSLSVGNSNAKEFFLEHKTELGIKRVRSDIRLWTEDDMLGFGFFLKSDEAREYRRQLRQFIKTNAMVNTVSREEHEQLKGRLEYIEELLKGSMPAVHSTASMAGRLLRTQRDNKHLRLVM